MRKTILSYLGIFVAVVILASSSGLYLNKMVCLMSGNSVISMVPFDECPMGDEDGDSIANCCDISQLLLKMKIDANVGKYVSSLDLIAVPVAVEFISGYSNFTSILPAHQFADLPPPKTVGIFLALVQVYII